MTQSSIDVNTLRQMLDRGQPVTVLDVRRANDWAEWAIPGSLNADVYDVLTARNPQAMAGAELPAGRPVVTI